MLSAEASDTGLVSAAQCQFPKNDYPRVQGSPEPLAFLRRPRFCSADAASAPRAR